jgi:hypothetical protein
MIPSDAEKVAQDLRGTTGSLEDSLRALDRPSELRDDMQFLAAIDGLVFECTGCGWWHEISEMSPLARACEDFAR